MKLKLLLILIFLNNQLFSVAGQLDKNFNSNSKNPGTLVKKILLASQVNSILRGNGGKIFASGHSFDTTFQFTHARFNANGSIDTTLNPNGNLGPQKGIVRTNIGYTSTINASVLDKDGKLLVCGTSQEAANILEQITIARYNKNGTLDQTFNPGGNLGPRKGIVIKNSWLTSAAHAITLDKNNKIIVAGSVWHNNFGHVFAILRLLPDGSLDASFNQNGEIPGVIRLNIDDQVSRILAVKIDADNKILVAGFSTLGFTVARFNPNGSIDQTFNANGIKPGVFTILIGQDDPLPRATSIAINKNNKIYIAGNTTEGFTLIRLLNNGTLDATFNPNGVTPGVVTTIINENAQSYSVKLDENQRPIVSGYSSKNNDSFRVFTLARYRPNGNLDASFNPNGNQPGTRSLKIRLTSSAFTCAINKRTAKILLAGVANNNFAIARFLGK